MLNKNVAARMKIVFATTQSTRGSTMIGRVQPLAEYLAKRHTVYILALQGAVKKPVHSNGVCVENVGYEPFSRTAQGKKRFSGVRVVTNMLATALRTAYRLIRLRPDVIIIVKTLPANVLGVRLARMFFSKTKIIVDADDFELTANTLTTLQQRAAVHWAERTAVRLADGLVAATPFLADHLEQLSGHTKEVELLPTGFKGGTPLTSNLPSTAQIPTLLYLGSVSISSGHRVDLLPAILAELRTAGQTVQLKIAGDGDDAQVLQQAFNDQSLSAVVEWTGRFSINDLPQLLNGVHVILDPVDDSVAQRAKSSFRVAVALAAGLPVITSNIGIRPYLIPEILHERLFAVPLNAASYAHAIQALITNPFTVRESAAMRQASVRLQWDTLGEEYEQYLLNI